MRQVKPFEVTIVGLMKINQQRHDFTRTQRAGAQALALTGGELLAPSLRQKLLAKVIDLTKQLYQIRLCYTHDKGPPVGLCATEL